ncbi:MAG: lamin tail domain-containing protein, partial [Myxococcaceae bacterium]
MRFLPRALPALALLLLYGCGGNATPPPELPAPPTIKSFGADKTRISAGDSVTLTFQAENATSAELVDQNGEKIELTGDASAGSAKVEPAASSFFVLRVQGEGGRDNAFVQVAVDEPLKEVSLVAVPPQIDAGETAQLIWTAFGAKGATLQSGSGDVLQIDLSKGAGVVDLTPARTTSYTLVGTGAADQQITATTEIKVRPVLSSFEALPGAARAGEKITFSWKTAGAAQVVLSETTFGTLTTVTAPAQVGNGTYEWTVPATHENGDAVADGQPLRFTLTVTQSDPAVTLTRTIDSFVGEGPKIVAFDAPGAVTEGKSFALSWSTVNAQRVQVYANGGVIYEPLSVDRNGIATGSVTLAAPESDSIFKVVAIGHGDARMEMEKVVRVVKAPQITDFTLPTSIAQGGAPANAQWATTDTNRIIIRVKNGPTVFTSGSSTGTTSLYPGLKTTFVLEAFNAAGDRASAERTVDVHTPASVGASPAAVTVGETVSVNWDLTQASITQLFGDPNAPALKTNPTASFFDLDNLPAASEVQLVDADEGVEQLALATPFRFPFLNRTVDTFFVSTNVFIAFDPTGPLQKNEDLTKNALPAMVAPFWDNLYLGDSSKVLYYVEGNAFPRRLIVQWSRAHIDDASELTFQAQLWETGEVRFAYKTLSGVDSGGENATIGWRLNNSMARNYSVNTSVVTPDDELVFFISTAVTGQFDFAPEHSGAYTLFASLLNGSYAVYPAKMNVLVPGSVLVSELMVLPEATASQGQWVELENVTDEDIDLSGTKLVSTATTTSFTLPEGLTLPAGQFLVIGQSTDPMAAGGATVQLAWTDLMVDTATGDEIALTAVRPVSGLSYVAADLIAGQSVQSPDRTVIDTAGQPLTCTTRTLTFGMNGAIGTPGAANETCFAYDLSRIAVNYTDISKSGTAAFTPGADLDSVRAQISFGNNPFTYFGV